MKPELNSKSTSITFYAEELARDLSHLRIATEVRLPLERVLTEDSQGNTTYTKEIMQLYESYYEYYMTVLIGYKDN